MAGSGVSGTGGEPAGEGGASPPDAVVAGEGSAGDGVKQECIEAVLDEVDRRGGIDACLSEVGVTPAQLEVLRAQAIAD